ncbi:MAG TPA: YdeI/OmpD-associated family protein [Thermoanaerobaculia bacterium]|nr:YdeI/OmpD-associated family protein [Thermoanaerobaculia bacterium]
MRELDIYDSISEGVAGRRAGRSGKLFPGGIRPAEFSRTKDLKDCKDCKDNKDKKRRSQPLFRVLVVLAVLEVLAVLVPDLPAREDAKKEETRRKRLAEAVSLLEQNKKLGLK